MTKKLSDVMSKNVISISPQQSIKEAADLMSRHNVGSLPVVENGQLKGMITDRDITLRSTAKGGNETAKVAECMTASNLVTASPTMDVTEASRIMSENQLRRLPVVDHQQMVGMISLGDVATEGTSEQEAGAALSNISSPSEPKI